MKSLTMKTNMPVCKYALALTKHAKHINKQRAGENGYRLKKRNLTFPVDSKLMHR